MFGGPEVLEWNGSSLETTQFAFVYIAHVFVFVSDFIFWKHDVLGVVAVVRKCLSEMVCHWRQFSLYIVVYTFVYIYICICLWFCICLKTWCSGGSGGGSEVLEGNGSWLETIQSTIHRWSLPAIPGEETFEKRKRSKWSSKILPMRMFYRNPFSQTFYLYFLLCFYLLCAETLHDMKCFEFTADFLWQFSSWTITSCLNNFLSNLLFFLDATLQSYVFFCTPLQSFESRGEFDEFILSLRPDIEFVAHIISWRKHTWQKILHWL